jgi:hypothetical protein
MSRRLRLRATPGVVTVAFQGVDRAGRREFPVDGVGAGSARCGGDRRTVNDLGTGELTYRQKIACAATRRA